MLLRLNSPAPLILLGKALLKQQELPMGKKYLDKALAMDPRNYIADTLLGQVYRSLGQADKASQEFHLVEQVKAKR